MPRFTRQHRLNRKEEFQFVFDNGTKLTRKSLIALYAPNKQSHARLGMVISKQRIPLAIARNYIKRLIRESFRQSADQLKNLDVIVMVRSIEDPKRDKKHLSAEIDHFWSELSR